jgi:hypothetical protein
MLFLLFKFFHFFISFIFFKKEFQETSIGGSLLKSQLLGKPRLGRLWFNTSMDKKFARTHLNRKGGSCLSSQLMQEA